MNSDEVKILHGRFINVPDMKEQRKVMVLHARNARLMFGDEVSALGKTVSSMGIAWTVVGIYDHRWRSQTYVPYSTLKGITGNGNEAYELEVTVRNISTLEEGEQAEKEIRGTLARSHSFNPHDNNAVWIWNAFTQNITARRGLGYLDLAVWLIGLFTLLTGIVGVSNIMFVSVRERTHEIGIRRALGAKPRSILGQVVAESVAITSLFGYIGLVAGMVVLQIIDMLIGNSNDFKDPTVDVAMALKVTLALVVAGTMAGLFPAIKATKVKPVEALRDE
jgi:putative ABC transport system permease protein